MGKGCEKMTRWKMGSARSRRTLFHRANVTPASRNWATLSLSLPSACDIDCDISLLEHNAIQIRAAIRPPLTFPPSLPKEDIANGVSVIGEDLQLCARNHPGITRVSLCPSFISSRERERERCIGVFDANTSANIEVVRLRASNGTSLGS